MAVIALLHPVLLTWLGTFLVLAQFPEPADLIVVLGGDFWGPRVIEGAKLGSRGYAPKVLISGPPYGKLPESELAIQFLAEQGYPKDMFLSYPNTAGSTIEEAIALCGEVNSLGARSALIVTSAYHSRRANLVFHLYCPGLKFRSIAAPDPQFEIRKWWTNARDRKVFFSEWSKMIGTLFWKYPEYQLSKVWGLLALVQGS